MVQFYLGENATLPIRMLRQRTVACAAIYVFFLSFGLFIHVYYLPIQGSSAIESAYKNLAYLLGIVFSSIIGGVGATLIGYTVPFMVFGSALFCVGCGLLHTLTVGTPTREWIGYQLLAAFGAGFGLQLPVIAVQSVLPSDDIPVGSALIVFAQILGGALSVSIAQNIFLNALTSTSFHSELVQLNFKLLEQVTWLKQYRYPNFLQYCCNMPTLFRQHSLFRLQEQG